MWKMPLYDNIRGRMVVYWLSNTGVRLTCLLSSLPLVVILVLLSLIVQFGAGPLILSWINEICSDDTEKRALLVAAGNDFGKLSDRNGLVQQRR
jgi:MFS transporter, ACS family, pantothenate transporter